MSLPTSFVPAWKRLLAAVPALLAAATLLVSGPAAWSDDKPDKKPDKKADKKAEKKADKKADKKAALADDPLTKKLAEYHEKLVQIHKDMLKEVDEALAKNAEASKKASEDVKKTKRGTKEHKEALQAARKAHHDRQRLMHVKHVVERHIRPGRVPRSSKAPEEVVLGMHLGSPSREVVKQLKLQKENGMVIEALIKDSVADKAGLLEGDILLTVDGKPLPTNRVKMRALLAGLKSGAVSEIVVMRAGKKETVKLTVPPPEKPEEPEKK